MPSRKRPKRIVKNQRARENVQRLGSVCGTCGLRARRVSDRFCSACGLTLGAAKSVRKAATVRQPDLMKAARAAVSTETDRLSAVVRTMGADIAAAGQRIDELEAMAGSMPFEIQQPGRVTKSATVTPDPFAEMTVDLQPIKRNPLLEAELLSSDPARREAAWNALYNPRTGS